MNPEDTIWLIVASYSEPAIGGNILRNLRKQYREWLLAQWGGVCAICGEGTKPDNPWNLAH
jgi:hypothetical protein